MPPPIVLPLVAPLTIYRMKSLYYVLRRSQIRTRDY
jgi:hypothetical protein